MCFLPDNFCSQSVVGLSMVVEIAKIAGMQQVPDVITQRKQQMTQEEKFTHNKLFCCAKVV